MLRDLGSQPGGVWHFSMVFVSFYIYLNAGSGKQMYTHACLCNCNWIWNLKKKSNKAPCKDKDLKKICFMLNHGHVMEFYGTVNVFFTDLCCFQTWANYSINRKYWQIIWYLVHYLASKQNTYFGLFHLDYESNAIFMLEE